MYRLACFIQRFVAYVGHAVSLFVLLMIATIVVEMAARALFDVSLPWAHDVSTWLQVAMIFLGAGWALQQGQFVRVDVIFGSLGPRAQAAVDLVVTTVFFAVFVYVIISRGYGFFMQSWVVRETSANGAWSGPVYVAKALIPLGGILLALAWLANLVMLWRQFRGTGANGCE